MKSQTYFVEVPALTTWKLPGLLTRNFVQTGGASYCQVYCKSKQCNLWRHTSGFQEEAAVYGDKQMPGKCPLQNSAN